MGAPAAREGSSNLSAESRHVLDATTRGAIVIAALPAARTVAAVVLATLAGCSGSGVGLDENGRPFDDTSAPLTAEFASIQSKVFDVYCVRCHAGASAPVGLRLTAGLSYAALVNATAVEVPSLRRVSPGNPAASYLLQKVSGTAAVGQRMPLGGPPLPDDALAAIRQWIQDGAAAPRVAEVLTPAPGTAFATSLDPVFPLEAERVNFQTLGFPDAMSGPIVIAADAELDGSTLQPWGVSLVRSGGDGRFEDGNDIDAGLVAIEVRVPGPHTVFAVSPPGPWIVDRYRLRISGSGPLPVRDRMTRAIDGDADGEPGGDFLLEFDVGPGEDRR